MSNKTKGDELERLVEIIEKSINPQHRIERNVWLPILNSTSNDSAQCDVVIRSGSKGRETLTIVEVQNRKTKVKIGEFRDWRQKMKDVGAQHLFCVSRHDFASSIKEQARLSGDAIKLITIKQLDADSVPLDMFGYTFSYKNFHADFKRVNFVGSKSDAQKAGIRTEKLVEMELRAKDNVFSEDRTNATSLLNVTRNYFSPPPGKFSGNNTITVGASEKSPLYILINDNYIKVKIEINFDWNLTIKEIPVSMLSYEQNEFGAMAWVLQMSYKTKDGRVWAKIPFIKKGAGRYEIKHAIFGGPEDTKITISIIRDK